MENVFDIQLHAKFEQLIKQNEDYTKTIILELIKDVKNIDMYIVMKKYLDGDELKGAINDITKKINLSKGIYDFLF